MKSSLEDPELYQIWDYLQSECLPTDDQEAKKIAALAQLYALRRRMAKRNTLIVRYKHFWGSMPSY